jgi:hypothetical protein
MEGGKDDKEGFPPVGMSSYRSGGRLISCVFQKSHLNPVYKTVDNHL